MPSGGHDFYVHGTKDDSSQINFGPFNTLNQAIQFAEDQQASGNIVSWTITYTNAQGNEVQYDEN